MKVLFAGMGSIGQRHVRNLRALMGEDVEILAYRAKRQTPLLDHDMTVRQGVALEEAYGLRSFDCLDAALGENPDAVFIANPNTLHLPVAIAAAQHGCHLFIEKPISHTLEGVDELIRIAEKKRLVTFVGYQFRFHPGLQKLKSLLDQGSLGQLVAAHVVNGEYLPGWHPYEDYRMTHPARRDLGGGCLSIQTHEIDYALWLFGIPENIYAVGGHLSRLELDVEDSVTMLMACSWRGEQLPVNVHLDYLQQPPQRTCEVYGDTGKARYDYYTNTLEYYNGGTGRPKVDVFEGFERNQMFVDELKHFLACVRGEEQSLIDLREARRSLLIAQCAKESLKTGNVIRIEL
jgi:predicted dehydrogenase